VYAAIEKNGVEWSGIALCKRLGGIGGAEKHLAVPSCGYHVVLGCKGLYGSIMMISNGMADDFLRCTFGENDRLVIPSF
jgi:hypothetical protein